MDPAEIVTAPLPADIAAALHAAGLVPDAAPAACALAGGVSCDVWKVAATDGAIVVKRALPRLRVDAEWYAPVGRVDAEVRWLRQVRAIDARLAPEVLAELPAQHGFAMRFVPDAPVWKDELMAGRVNETFAAAVGSDLARIHAATAGAAQGPDTLPQFTALRIDPFLLYVADRDAALAVPLRALAAGLSQRRVALVHGDVSPKNILVGPRGPVFLDAECAVRGDPAFDLALCSTHLLLKAVWRADDRYRAAAAALVAAYAAGIAWEDPAALGLRAGALTAALLLARVEGKSPAQYLTDPAQRHHVRVAAAALLHDQHPIDVVVDRWENR